MKSGIYQQPLGGSYSNLKLKLLGSNQFTKVSNEDNLQQKTSSNERRPPMKDALQRKMSSNERRPPTKDILQRKMNSNGRSPQNMKSGISQQSLGRTYLNLKQPLVRSYSNYKPKLMGSNQKWTKVLRQALNEVEYFRNRWADLYESGTKAIYTKTSKWRWPQINPKRQ